MQRMIYHRQRLSIEKVFQWVYEADKLKKRFMIRYMGIIKSFCRVYYSTPIFFSVLSIASAKALRKQDSARV